MQIRNYWLKSPYKLDLLHLWLHCWPTAHIFIPVSLIYVTVYQYKLIRNASHLYDLFAKVNFICIKLVIARIRKSKPNS